MTIKLVKEGIDLAIITTDLEKMTVFYRDVLGLEYLGEMKTRSSSDGLVRQFRCGATIIKVVTFSGSPPIRSSGETGLRVAGFRYFTITVANLEEIAAACVAAGYNLITPIKEIAGGARIAITEDPDGNWVEFLTSS